MPLRPGAPVSDTMHELKHHGSRKRSHRQMVAIALANERKGRRKGRRRSR